MIELVGFSKCYGRLLAVDRLTLKVAPGETFGFIGRNGAGKTTTIRFLATLLKATQGDGIVNGYSVARRPLDVRRSIGYMPDSFSLFPRMKVGEFLDLFATAYRIGRSRRKAVVEGLLAQFELTGKRKAALSSLSRGMKQRLCLARALLHDPPVLILDEPATGLDPQGRIEMKRFLQRLRSQGKTILISSHILSELADCCTSIGIIEQGRLLVCGPIDEVYRRLPRNRIVEIKFLEQSQRGLAILHSLPETRKVAVEGNRVTVELAADDGQLAALIERLVAEGVRMVSFAEQEPTLEDVFVRATGEAAAKLRGAKPQAASS